MWGDLQVDKLAEAERVKLQYHNLQYTTGHNQQLSVVQSNENTTICNQL